MWLALVTMTTVGYGDFVPKSVVGYVIASILTVVSVLFIVARLQDLLRSSPCSGSLRSA